MGQSQLPKIINPGSKLLTTAEAAARLGLTNPHTLCVWRTCKRYPELEYIKVGRLVRYREDAIEQFLRSRTVSDITR